jgi:DNA-binding CsgD family transcriptional regulator
MGTLNQIEFYTLDAEVWYRKPDGTSHKLDENDYDMVAEMLEHIKEFYPDAFAALDAYYKKLPFDYKYKKFRIVNAFVKCNFGAADPSELDVGRKGVFRFEHVNCPMRGECPRENIVCNPRFNAEISDGETRVLRLLYKGYDNDEIADKLFLSPLTVRNHIRNAYTRLGIHEKAEFIKYADEHELFKDDENGDD